MLTPVLLLPGTAVLSCTSHSFVDCWARVNRSKKTT
ncbi:unnamed protein product [Chondrus crispus]|uniref:Uncharacterized protein n=1 Tax=Chondrus crispus TaxID=2769 RepID=R7QH82_CHOCR|nr:unnamed protein product [Chondrus crispus]CDF36826.1 unnamed protein product [Chondrus crispus]|eukprot:XP_005716645.1 unnamed protein product [Chondrus crispus]